jgi:hypothetical protein
MLCMLWRGWTESWIVWPRADGPEGARVRAQMMRLGLYQRERLASYDTAPDSARQPSHDGEKLRRALGQGCRICARLRGAGSIQLQFCKLAENGVSNAEHHIIRSGDETSSHASSCYHMRTRLCRSVRPGDTTVND